MTRIPSSAEERERRLTGRAALGVVWLTLPVFCVGALFPTPLGDPAALVAHLARHRTVTLLSLYLAALAWGGVLIVFGAGLRALLRRAEGEGGVWSLVAFGACVATAVAILAAITLLGVVAFRAPEIDAATASLLYDAGAFANLMTAFPNAVYTIAAAVVIGRTSVLPHWIAHLALLVAGIHLASALSMARSGALGPWGLLPSLAPLSHAAWLAAIGSVLVRSRAGLAPAA